MDPDLDLGLGPKLDPDPDLDEDVASDVDPDEYPEEDSEPLLFLAVSVGKLLLLHKNKKHTKAMIFCNVTRHFKILLIVI